MTARLRTRGTLAALAIAVVYVTTALLTTHLSHRPTLPLFEGLPSAPYRWMEPPPDFASSNVKPTGKTATVTIVGQGSGNDSIATDDGQFTVTLAPGAIPARPGVSIATVTLTPLKPSTLTTLPNADVPDGNAYSITVRYGDGTALAAFAKPVSYLLRTPTTADAGLFGHDASGVWRTVPTINTKLVNHYPYETTLIGVFVAATREQVFQTVGTGGGSGSPVAAIVAIVVVVVVLAAVAFVIWRRRGRDRAAPPSPVRTPRK